MGLAAVIPNGVQMNLVTLMTILGIALILIGFLLITLSVIMPLLKGKSRSRVSGGGVILVGPFPIIIGTRDVVKAMIVATLFFMIVMVIIVILNLMAAL